MKRQKGQSKPLGSQVGQIFRLTDSEIDITGRVVRATSMDLAPVCGSTSAPARLKLAPKLERARYGAA